VRVHWHSEAHGCIYWSASDLHEVVDWCRWDHVSNCLATPQQASVELWAQRLHEARSHDWSAAHEARWQSSWLPCHEQAWQERITSLNNTPTHSHPHTLTHSLTHSLVTNAQFLHVSTPVMPSLSGEGQLLRYYLRYCYVIPPFLSLNQQSQRTGAKKTQVRTQVFNWGVTTGKLPVKVFMKTTTNKSI